MPEPAKGARGSSETSSVDSVVSSFALIKQQIAEREAAAVAAAAASRDTGVVHNTFLEFPANDTNSGIVKSLSLPDDALNAAGVLTAHQHRISALLMDDPVLAGAIFSREQPPVSAVAAAAGGNPAYPASSQRTAQQQQHEAVAMAALDVLKQRQHQQQQRSARGKSQQQAAQVGDNDASVGSSLAALRHASLELLALQQQSQAPMLQQRHRHQQHQQQHQQQQQQPVPFPLSSTSASASAPLTMSGSNQLKYGSGRRSSLFTREVYEDCCLLRTYQSVDSTHGRGDPNGAWQLRTIREDSFMDPADLTRLTTQDIFDFDTLDGGTNALAFGAALASAAQQQQPVCPLLEEVHGHQEGTPELPGSNSTAGTAGTAAVLAQTSGSDAPATVKNALEEHELTEEMRARIPRDENEQMLSYGSIGHEEGTCKPCVFFHHPKKGCHNGERCLFCHFPHTPKKRVRVSRKKRAARQAALAAETTGDTAAVWPEWTSNTAHLNEASCGNSNLQIAAPSSVSTKTIPALPMAASGAHAAATMATPMQPFTPLCLSDADVSVSLLQQIVAMQQPAQGLHPLVVLGQPPAGPLQPPQLPPMAPYYPRTDNLGTIA